MDNAIIKREKTVNYQMSLLLVIAISSVILGHINFPAIDMSAPGTFYGWFPYYSFHLPLFMFVTGYFYKDISEEKGFLISFGRFVLKKAKSMLVPYYIINGIFLISGTLLAGAGITFLRHFKFTEWLTLPWTRPYIITFSVPTWYLIALFIAEIYFVILRKLVRTVIKKDPAGEICILAVTLVLGIASVYYTYAASPSQTAIVYLRSVPMLFFIQTGYFYRKYLERFDTLASGWYFLIVFFIQFLLILLSGNDVLSPGLYGMLEFGPWGYNYFIGGLTGTALWLRITRILASIPKQSGFLIFIGNNTKYIMAFHVFGFFLLNCIFSLLRQNKIGLIFLEGFSPRTFKSYLYYLNNTTPRFTVLYFLAGLFFSLLAALVIRSVSRFLRRHVHI